MKKIKLIALLVVVLVMLTACGGKTLTCEIEFEEGFETNTIYRFNRTGDEIIKIETSSTVTLTEDIVEENYIITKRECEELDEPGLKCSVTRRGNTIISTTTIDVSRLSSDSDAFNKELLKSTYDDIKNMAEDIPFMTCR